MNDVPEDKPYVRPEPASLLWVGGVSPASLPQSLSVPAQRRSDKHVSLSYPWGWERVAKSKVKESWRGQIAILDLDGYRVRIQACLEVDAFGDVAGDQHDATGAGWPVAGEMLLAATSPGPVPLHWGTLEASRDDLLDVVTIFGVSALKVTLVDRRSAWAEPGLLAISHSADQADIDDMRIRFLTRCRQNGIKRIVRIAKSRWQVLDIGTNEASRVRVVSTDPSSVTRDGDPRCPLMATPGVGELCPVGGGPYGSAAIHAAAGWSLHRAMMVNALGCQSCEGGKRDVPTQGREGRPARELRDALPNPVPNRWLKGDSSRDMNHEKQWNEVDARDDDFVAKAKPPVPSREVLRYRVDDPRGR
jgi:hypothetical protein